jgi:hypothetical protein
MWLILDAKARLFSEKSCLLWGKCVKLSFAEKPCKSNGMPNLFLHCPTAACIQS